MRVLWTHNFDPAVRGGGSFMHTLARGMAAQGVDIELMYLGRLNRPTQLWAARREVRRRSRGFDLVHAQFGSACGLATAAAPTPRVLSLRGSDWHRYRGPDRRERWHAAMASAFTRMSLGAFDAVVTMSERMTSELRQAGTARRASTIADPVDTVAFRPMDRARARSDLFGTASDAPWVLFTTLSSTNPIKRVELATEAVRIAARRVPGLELKIASGIPHDRMPLFVAACNVALCTSTHEGWPNSLKEALACGVPFVSTDVSDMASIAARRPSCRVGPPDAQALAALIVESLAAPPDPTLQDEVAGMTLEAASRRLAALYAEVLGRPGGH